MTLTSSLLIAAVLLAAASALGLLLRRSAGRARVVRPSAGAVLPSDIGAPALGERATLVQFSTELCSGCPAARRLLGEIAAASPGVRHVDVDVTFRRDLAGRFNLLQSPTTLVLDGSGTIVARIGGVPRRDVVLNELAKTDSAVSAR